MLREIPDCELTDNPDYERWLFETQRAEWEEEQRQAGSETTSLLSHVLAKAEEKRFNKAAKGLREGQYTVQITLLSHGIVSAYVTNGDKQPYGVSLSAHAAVCSCPDAMYRHVTCHHAIALAVKLIQDGVTIPAAPVPNLKLARLSPNFDTSLT
jgi:hypothetical protein